MFIIPHCISSRSLCFCISSHILKKSSNIRFLLWMVLVLFLPQKFTYLLCWYCNKFCIFSGVSFLSFMNLSFHGLEAVWDERRHIQAVHTALELLLNWFYFYKMLQNLTLNLHCDKFPMPYIEIIKRTEKITLWPRWTHWMGPRICLDVKN